MASTSVFLNVQDIDRSLGFYETLGFAVTHATKDKAGRTLYADLELDGAELGLGHIPSNDDPGFRAWVATPLGAGVVVYVTVPDVDAVFERAKAAKAVIEVPPETRSYGRVLTLNDPDGYTITFITEPRRRRRAPVRRRAKAKKSPAKKARRGTRKGNRRRGR